MLSTNAVGRTGEHLHNCFITEQGSLSNLSTSLLGISHFDTITGETVLKMNVQVLKKASPNLYALHVTILLRYNLGTNPVGVSLLSFFTALKA